MPRKYWLTLAVTLGLGCGVGLGQKAAVAARPSVAQAVVTVPPDRPAIPLTSWVQYCNQYSCVSPAQYNNIPDPSSTLDNCPNGPWLLDIEVYVCGSYSVGSSVACSASAGSSGNLGSFPSLFFLTHQASNLWSFSDCISQLETSNGFRLASLTCATSTPAGIETICVTYSCNDCE